ncbi:sensor histidine kinase [Pontibacter sp. SGAir0037]|uniref:sensor histidine kinase n=1 Tax=Pontibacter sp. SGAir0037 TaxID=2571030 RepID=UPI0010CCF3F5|nr:sensor histidine kinase [Pontibacter sp. SGAir0037]QCR21819.1 histidine kinase [Pontibacter sp. SGAir0037]
MNWTATPLALLELSMKKWYQITLHFICWLVIITITLYYLQSNQLLNFNKFVDVTIALSFYAVIFYFNWYVLIPNYLARNRILLYIALVLATLVVFALVRSPLDFYVFKEFNPNMKILYSYERLVQYMLGGFMVIFISSALKVTGNYIRNERLNKELETQKLTAELAYLKSQVNPHFLFNTLNNIYSLAYKQSPETPDAIMKLSLLMRYMLYESNDTLVSLEKEVEHIHNFIDLQKLRLREHTSIKFNIKGSLAGKSIAPMMMMTLVENAFKHGLVSKNEIGITFNLEVKETCLQFSTINNISTHKKKDFGGIGLENLRRRLNLLYLNRHKLSFEEKEGAFYATLKLYFQPIK